MKNDNMRKLVMDIILELGSIKNEPIKPSKKLRKLAVLEEKAKERFGKLKSAN